MTGTVASLVVVGAVVIFAALLAWERKPPH